MASQLADKVVRLVGSGADRPDGESSVPIDIHYSKVSEWLVGGGEGGVRGLGVQVCVSGRCGSGEC